MVDRIKRSTHDSDAETVPGTLQGGHPDGVLSDWRMPNRRRGGACWCAGGADRRCSHGRVAVAQVHEGHVDEHQQQQCGEHDSANDERRRNNGASVFVFGARQVRRRQAGSALFLPLGAWPGERSNAAAASCCLDSLQWYAVIGAHWHTGRADWQARNAAEFAAILGSGPRPGRSTWWWSAPSGPWDRGHGASGWRCLPRHPGPARRRR